MTDSAAPATAPLRTYATYIARIIVLAAAYYASGRLGLELAYYHPSISPLWPPAGVALAALLTGGIRLWPGVLLGAALVNAAHAPTYWADAAIALGNTLAAIAGAVICRGVRGPRRDLANLADALRFVGAALVSPVIAATGGVLALSAAADLQVPVYRAWLVWWSGDAFGVLLVGTLLLAWSVPRKGRLPAARRLEAWVLAGTFALLAGIVLRPPYVSPVLLLPAVMWASLRFGIRGGSLVGFAAIAAASFVAVRSGLAAPAALPHGLLDLQIFALATALLSVVIAAVTEGRRRAVQHLRATNRSQGALFDASPLGIVGIDEAGIVTAWNRAAERLFGWHEDEVLGRHLPIVPEGHAEEYASLRERIRAQGGVVRHETRRQHRNGRLVDVELSAAGLRDAEANPAGVVAMFEEITSRKAIQAALRESNARLQAALESLPFDFWMSDAEGRCVLQNPASSRQWGPRVGLLPDEQTTADPAVAGRWRADDLRALAGEVVQDEHSYVFADGARDFYKVLAPIRDGESIIGMLGVNIDITARKRAERERARFAQILESTIDLVGIAGADERVEFINPAGRRLLGLLPDDDVRRSIFEFLAPGTAAMFREAVRPAVTREGVWSGEADLLSRDGAAIPVHLVIIAHRGADGTIDYTSTVARDVRPWREAQQALDEQTRRVQLIVDSAVDAVVTSDAEGTIIGWDGRAEAIFGWRRAEVIGCPLGETIVPPQYRAAHRRGLAHAAATGEQRIRGTIEMTALRRDGTEFPVELAISRATMGGRPVFSAFIRDVTERRAAADALRRSEEQLRQSQKMEAVGQLAGGVAHDFNNLLTTVLGFADLVIDQLPEGDPVIADVDEIKRAAERAAALTRQLLAFSRRQIIEPRVLDLNGIVAGVSSMLRRLIGEKITLATDLDAGLGHTRVDRGQLEQIIINLAVNARDAMPDGGRLLIATRNAMVDSAMAMRHPELEPGPHVVLSVHDAGVGMDAETLSHAFEPFFTTKEAGKGTGLGLSTVYGIVRQHRGGVLARSEPGAGTEIDIYLRRVTGAGERERTPRAERQGGGTERILLVEDEAVIRELAERILQNYGYEVVTAGNADEATAVVLADQRRIDLLVTDVVMPGRNGPRLADDLRELRPDLRALFITGYTGDAVAERGLLDPAVRYLHKPFTPDRLAQAVRAALDARDDGREARSLP